ncbi:MAG: hypothetical protein K9H26_10720 [Prolixibacteraceae bacterium]|nr:hypothetical protein [Prolixibacteraceae bacterium]
MKKKNVLIFTAVSAIILIAIIIWIALKNQKIEVDAEQFPLQVGNEGEYVALLQQWLIDQGASLDEFGVDGIFGAETLAALTAITGSSQMTYQYFIENVWKH